MTKRASRPLPAALFFPTAAFLLLTGLALLAGCTRSVTWDEEVPLATGETISVKRSGTYSFGFSAGSGQVGYSPDRKSSIEFTYKDKKYRYYGEARPMVLAISPEGKPNLVSSAGVWGNQNAYPCVTPYYVQFRPDDSGRHWTWPDRIEPWLYDLPSNLLIGLVPLEDDGKKISQRDRKRLNGSIMIFSEYQRIDPTKKPENCVNPKPARRSQDG